ncbi:erythromycin esterase-like protein [Filimonas zeae]|uniref:erythromycin esterase family protein n=1 Tax=Filimonas zeae TaxID=1737353 RepID=UPI00166D44E0|nr:erythromycin esterase family protein [Filimonas zeae]MDR6339106.1 erythromycin esterase-like protein [Filimonas zeae]
MKKYQHQLFLLLLITLVFNLAGKTQTTEKKYDLDFSGVNDCSWGWLSAQSRSKFVYSNFEHGKPALKVSYRAYGMDKAMRFLLLKTILLPGNVKGKKCQVALQAAVPEGKMLTLYITTMDAEERPIVNRQLTFSGSALQKKAVSFTAGNDKAISIGIYYQGDSIPQQVVWLQRIQVTVNGKDIGNSPEYAARKDSTAAAGSLSKSRLVPLTAGNDSTLLPDISDLNNNRLIGLGECTHGSATIRSAAFQFIKNLIVQQRCRLVLLETPMDVTLLWDLYAQGSIGAEYEQQITNDVKMGFGDYALFMDFLRWLRNYNMHTDKPVHILGIDYVIAPQLYLLEYHHALLGSTNGKWYLQQIQDKKYDLIYNHAQADTLLRQKLDQRFFQLYLSYLKSLPVLQPGILMPMPDERDSGMAKQVQMVMETLLHAGEKAVIYAHSSHLTALPTNRFKETYYPLGYYLKQHYGRQYFTVSFQIAAGYYTQDVCSGGGGHSKDTLKPPPVYSFEYAGLATGLPYFYYPSAHIGSGVQAFCRIERGSRFKNWYQFASPQKRFDAFVFIRNSEPLRFVEDMPAFYTGSHIYKRSQAMKAVLKETGITTP